MLKSKSIILLIIFLLPSFVAIYGQTKQEKKRFAEANDLMKTHHYTRAIEIFNSLKTVKALKEDCEAKIKEAYEKIAYIRVYTDNQLIDNESSINFEHNKCDTILTVRSNYQWRIDDYTQGIKEVSKHGNKLYVSFIKSNKDNVSKYERIKISAGTAPNKCERVIELQQAKHPPYLECSSNILNSPAVGFIDSVIVNTNVEWEIKHSERWCNIICDSNRIKIEVQKNDAPNERHTQIIVRTREGGKSVTINVIQSAGKEELMPAKSDLNILADGGTEHIKVFSNNNWSVKDDPGWCKAEKDMTTNNVRIECTENITGYTREGYIKLTTSSGNKVVSIKIVQPSNDMPKYPFETLEGKNVSFGVQVGGAYPGLTTSSSSGFVGSVVNYGLGNNNENASYKMGLGFTIGALADIRLYRNLYLKLGLDYTHLQYSNDFRSDVEIMSVTEPNVSYVKGVSKNSYKESYAFDIIDVPILASYRFVFDRSSCIHLDFGVYISYGINAKMDLSGTTDANMLTKYKIENGHYTNEKLSNGRYTQHFQSSASVDLYGKTAKIVERHTSGTDVSFSKNIDFKAQPFKRENFGLLLGVAYEYAGFCLGLKYRRDVTNMANEKYWKSERLKVLNATNNSNLNISGYRQHLGCLYL